VLSEGGKITRPMLMRSLPELQSPITVRLKFIKTGSLQYISHLDLQRTFNRILVRSGLPVWYSKGFNPHIKLVFSTPLSVGTQSECEYLDLRLDREMPLDKVKELLNAEMTEELYVTDVYIPTAKFSDIAYCRYEYEIFSDGVSKELCGEISELFSTSPLKMVKKTKSGEKEIDIVPLIKSFEVGYCESFGTLKLEAVLSAATDSFLNPEMIITALKERLLILCGDPSKEWYTITRKEALTAELKSFR